MAHSSRAVLITLVLLSVAVGAYEAVLFSFGHVAGQSFHIVWSLVFVLLLIFWLELDCKERKEIYRPFEFGFLLFLFWLPYLPYYLLRTRHAHGLLWLLGFVLLFYLGYALQWLVYVAR